MSVKSVTEVQELLTHMVVPHKRKHVNILPDHLTVLQGCKVKKEKKVPAPKKSSNILTRREYAALGLYTLPTKQLKYEEILPLHKLWKKYIKAHLRLGENSVVPKLYDKEYDAFSRKLTKCDFHGAKMRVIDSKCRTFIGLNGIVVLETKNVVKLVGEDNCLRTVPKPECIFGINIGNAEFIIFGKQFSIRPAERSVKKIRTPIQPNF